MGLNERVGLGVKVVMKGICALVLACTVLLAASSPHERRGAAGTPEPARRGADFRQVRLAAGNMASVVNDLRRAATREDSQGCEAVGNLWMEVNRLKHEGERIRTIEWYVSDLEGSLRRGQQDAVTRRHILNNLDYELEALKRRPR